MNTINWLYLSDCFGVLVIGFITALGGFKLQPVKHSISTTHLSKTYDEQYD